MAITCNVNLPLLGKGSFQEVDIAGVTMPITKHSYIVKDITRLADTIRKAFAIAKEGRPGPVLVDITKDVTAVSHEYEKQTPAAICSSCKYTKEDIEKAISLIKESKRPFIYVGGGAVISGASKETTFEELYYHMNEFIVDNGFVNLDFMGNLGHSIVKAKNDRVYIEKGNTAKLGDVKYFTFEPHIAFPYSKFGYKKENIYYFDGDRLVEL